MNAPAPLIHIGYHKTGTTWLQRHVFALPSLALAPIIDKQLIDSAFVTINPLTFDANEARTTLGAALQEAEASGQRPVISHERLSGFDLLGGYDAGVIADRLHATFPDAHVLIVIRDQRSMMLSMYKQYVRKSGSRKIAKLWGPRTHQEARRPGPTLDVYEYHHLISYYRSLFGADRVHVLAFESLKEDPAAFVAEICRPLGVTPPADLPPVAANVGMPGFAVGPVRVTNTILRTFGLIPTDGGPIPRRGVQRARMRLVRTLSSRIPAKLSRGSDRRLANTVNALTDGRFGSSNRCTAQLTGLDLGALGYDLS